MKNENINQVRMTKIKHTSRLSACLAKGPMECVDNKKIVVMGPTIYVDNKYI